MWTKVLGLDQGWSNNQVYWIIWKYDNQCFKTRGPDFNRIMVKCNNMFHGTDNTQRMKVIQWVVHLGWNIPNLGGYPEDYTEVYSRYRIIHDYLVGYTLDYIKYVHCNQLYAMLRRSHHIYTHIIRSGTPSFARILNL